MTCIVPMLALRLGLLFDTIAPLLLPRAPTDSETLSLCDCYQQKLYRMLVGVRLLVTLVARQFQSYRRKEFKEEESALLKPTTSLDIQHPLSACVHELPCDEYDAYCALVEPRPVRFNSVSTLNRILNFPPLPPLPSRDVHTTLRGRPFVQYWRYEFPSLLTSTRLVPYVVLGTEALPEKARPSAPRGHRMRKARVAEVELARECDLGRNDDRVTVVSHLGHILRAGDTVLGFDVSSANLPEGEATGELSGSLPDVVLVRKVYPRNEDRDGSSGGKGDRHWKLGELEKDGGDGGGGISEKRDEAAAEKDYERFLQQLESDKDMRRQVNLYKAGPATAGAKSAAETGGDADEKMEDVEEMDEEEVRLEELLDGMTLDNPDAGPDGEDETGAASASIFEAGAAPAPNADVLALDNDPEL